MIKNTVFALQINNYMLIKEQNNMCYRVASSLVFFPSVKHNLIGCTCYFPGVAFVLNPGTYIYPLRGVLLYSYQMGIIVLCSNNSRSVILHIGTLNFKLYIDVTYRNAMSL